MKNFWKKFWWVFVLLIGVILVDELTKVFIFKSIPEGGSVNLIKNLLTIERVYNSGASFGMLKGQIWLFVSLTVVAVIIFGFIFVKYNFKKSKTFCVSFALICGGAIGNLIDRIAFRKVRDFIYIHFFPAIFNFADICVTIGTILLVIYLVFIYPKKQKEEKNGKTNI